MIGCLQPPFSAAILQLTSSVFLAPIAAVVGTTIKLALWGYVIFSAMSSEDRSTLLGGYGSFIVHDVWVYGPNATGLTLGLIQMVLKLIYPGKDEAARTLRARTSPEAWDDNTSTENDSQ